jgi:DNA replication licensing factor MCM4
VENIQLPPTLLSRFDLIYLVLDKANEITDKKLARHLVSLYYREPQSAANVLPLETLTSYISYARKTTPSITDEASKDLVEGYVNMRKLGGNKRTITATPRQLESLIRISEALAKMRLSSKPLHVLFVSD